MIDVYPKVKDEFVTVNRLLEGYSIARLGDGELKMAHGGEYNREPANGKMANELLEILAKPPQFCLPAIPTMDLKGPKGKNWQRHKERFMAVLYPKVQYYSAFITRPDSAPWIQTIPFALLVERLWAGKHVTVVCERKGSMHATVKLRATSVTHIECPHQGAYAVIDSLERQIMLSATNIAIMSIGPTATCLAARLSRRGIQAIDLGSAGGWLGKLLRQVDR